MATESTIVVQALHPFKGTNNDELWFKKGDIITVTQKEEGGWWEGTLGDKTGWFPANFVKEVKVEGNGSNLPAAQQRQYRAVVLKDIIDSEKAHVTELQGLVKTFLKPLEKSSILTTDEYRQLTGNINEVVDTHQQLLDLLEECGNKPSHEQRVGKIFLSSAPKIKTVHQAYCSTHPKAICILDLHKDELMTYMESCGATTPGLLVLTTGLSKPFRRLDKYSGMLQELERHVEINHPDRGDTQRSVSVYKEIAATCAATRRQKELELQVLTGPVRGWEGQSLAQLGDILHMGSVAVGPQHQDRYLVLFPDTLLVLSVSKRMSAFIYEGKLPLTGITITRLEDTDNCKNAFEITGPMIEKIVAICQSKEEANNWVDLLRRHTKGHHRTPPPVAISDSVPTPPPHLDRRGYSVRSSIISYSYTPRVPYKITLPPYFYPSTSPYAKLTKSFYRLVKEKIITHRLLKRLLYPEYINLEQIDLSQVKRRKHRTECYIRTGTCKNKCVDKQRSNRKQVDSDDESKSVSNSDSDSDNDNSGSSSDDNSDNDTPLQRQDVVVHDNDKSEDDEEESSNVSGSTASNPFGFIRYFNSESREADKAVSGDSFIDHGANIQQPRIIESLCILKDQENNDDEIIIPVSAAVDEEPNNKIKLSALVQTSQESGNSSFDCAPTKSYMACEDLVNIDESTEIQESLGPRQQYILKSRHSLPTKFVANRFNKSSLTMVYIPPWQSNSESNLASSLSNKSSPSKCNSSSNITEIKINTNSNDIDEDNKSETIKTRSVSSRSISLRSTTRSRSNSGSSCETTTHSSCLDIPVNPLPVPDKIVAELLYNSGPETENLIPSESVDSDQPEESPRNVIKPPTMFRSPFTNSGSTSPCFNFVRKPESDVIVDDVNVNLRLSNISFNKHSIDSDKRTSKRHSPKSSKENLELKSPSEIRKGIMRPHQPQMVARRDKRKTNSLRKCVSYHYLQLTQPSGSNYGQFCRCCTEPCHSRRSSDSGMAGSCTLNSPDLAMANDMASLLASREHYSMTDLPNSFEHRNSEDTRDVVSLSEIEARNFEAKDFEAQCRCTSPFGSTPRTSCQASTSDNIVGTRDSTTSMTSSTSSSPFPTPCPWESEKQIYEKVMKMKQEEEMINRKQKQHQNLLQQLKQQQWAAASLKSKSCDNLELNEPPESDEEPVQEIYRSGLYAHWWMKAKLPTEVINGILEESSSSKTADVSTSNDSVRNKKSKSKRK